MKNSKGGKSKQWVWDAYQGGKRVGTFGAPLAYSKRKEEVEESYKAALKKANQLFSANVTHVVRKKRLKG